RRRQITDRLEYLRARRQRDQVLGAELDGPIERLARLVELAEPRSGFTGSERERRRIGSACRSLAQALLDFERGLIVVVRARVRAQGSECPERRRVLRRCELNQLASRRPGSGARPEPRSEQSVGGNFAGIQTLGQGG